MAEILNIVSVISFVAAGVFAALAILFWFLFKIPHVIGDLSGRNARKSIELMRQNNEKAGKQTAKRVERKQETRNTSEKADGIRKIDNPNFSETGLLQENAAQGSQNQDTGLLIDDATNVLDGSGETALLVEPTETFQRKPSTVVISMIEEVMLIHTKEVI